MLKDFEYKWKQQHWLKRLLIPKRVACFWFFEGRLNAITEHQVNVYIATRDAEARSGRV